MIAHPTAHEGKMASSIKSILVNANVSMLLLFWKPKKRMNVTRPLQGEGPDFQPGRRLGQ